MIIMSMQPQNEEDPRFVFTLGDRLRRALQFAGVAGDEMASYLEVSPGTVSRWLNGRVRPTKQTMRLFALRTGYPLEWLENGTAPKSGSGPEGGAGGDVRSKGLEPPTF